MKSFLRIFALFALFAACSTTPDKAPVEEPQEPLVLKLLAFNDLHGGLEGPAGSIPVEGERIQAGGLVYMASVIDEIRSAHGDNTTLVAAGDLVGATPLISSLFHDEPTILALNVIGMNVSSVGNHEFDEGVEELLRKQNGGCHPDKGCFTDDAFPGAAFQYLAANVRWKESGETILPAFKVREYEGIRIGYIGLTLEKTPEIVSPAGIQDVRFTNEVEEINAIAEAMVTEGIQTIIVLIHEGGYPGSDQSDINECPDLRGPVVDITKALHPAVAVVVSGHTHRPYICEFNGTLLTGAASSARVLTEIDVHIDRSTGAATSRNARNIPITSELPRHPQVQAVIDKYSELSRPIASRSIGQIAEPILREASPNGQSPLGRLIANIQHSASSSEAMGGAQVAFMNPGGVRASLENAGEVTYEMAHTVQPFANSLVTMTLSGGQIHRLLEEQWIDQSHPKILQVSDGFTYAWSASAPEGSKVKFESIKLHGEPLQKDKQYRVTVNSFLADGGDGFTVLPEGTNRLGGPIDLESFVAYFAENSPVTGPSTDVIQRIE